LTFAASALVSAPKAPPPPHFPFRGQVHGQSHQSQDQARVERRPGHYYVTKKNSRTQTDKLKKKKYDPVAKKHVEYAESKIK